MDIYNKYLLDTLILNPTLNDSINIKYIDKFKHIQPNIYLNSYIDKVNKLDKKYIKFLDNIKDKNKYIQIFEYDLKKQNIKIDYDILCMNIYENIFLEYILNSTGKYFYTFKNIKDYEDYIKRLVKLDSITNRIILLLKKGIKKKITHTTIIINHIINYFKDSLNNQTYKHKKNIPNKIKKKYENSINKYLVKNIKKLLFFLENKYLKFTTNNLGLSYIKNGKSDYLTFLKINTYKSITPKKIFDIAKIELKKCLKNLDLIKNKLKFKGTIKELHYNINTNPKNLYTSNKKIIDDLKKVKDKIKRNILTKYFYNSYIDIDYNIKILDNADYGTSIYYLPPTNNKRGTFYFKDKSILNKNELYVLSLHEGNPGHNYEHLINIKNKVPKYILNNYYSGYSEGWATYTETLLESDNLYEVFYRYIYELIRIIRLYLDVGLNYYKWDYNKCSELFNKYLYVTDDFVKEEIIRYISNPGQAVSYKIGELLIQKYKKLYLKKNNNIKDFHKLVLDIGPCPLDIFIKEMKLKGFSI
tara:strand:+ start:355 stop:1941 length:1587 start_codon:yes stop_codon:yes gene_type:complete